MEDSVRSGVLFALALAAWSCGGGPGGAALSDGAETALPGPVATSAATTDVPQDAGAPARDCWSEEEGCHCDHPGQAIACKGPVSHFGSYVTCAGMRACENGYWGPCVPPNFKHVTH